MELDTSCQEQLHKIELDYIGDQIEELKGIVKTLQTSPILRLSNNLDFIKESIRQLLTNMARQNQHHKDLMYWLEKYNAKIDKMEKQIAKLEGKLETLEKLFKS